MSRNCYIGIDTSNYTTSVAICTEEGEVVCNLRRLLPVKAGECGLRQSDAVFAHVKNLPLLMDEAARFLQAQGMTSVAVGVSQKPRNAEDSYMPCFLSGVAAAHALAAPSALPIYGFAHQDGHIMAAAYSSGEQERLLSAPFYAWHVSGGTTEVLLVTPQELGFTLRCVGGSKDLHAGQVIDRIGVMLGLSFPCGKELEKLAVSYEGRIPRATVSVKDGWCNLSGLENLARKEQGQHEDASRTAAFVFDFLCRSMLRMCEDLEGTYGKLPVLFAGGVMSNRWMRKRLSDAVDACFAEPDFSADNAAGIALLCRRQHLSQK